MGRTSARSKKPSKGKTYKSPIHEWIDSVMFVFVNWDAARSRDETLKVEACAFACAEEFRLLQAPVELVRSMGRSAGLV